jgi:DNA-binding transcriptional MerR regulator
VPDRRSELSIETLVELLRRAPAEVARKPRAALEGVVRQLLDRASLVAPAEGDRRGATTTQQYRIDELARVAGTTTRNIRAYQDRGILHPPRRAGRVALFDDTHLARLKVITSMLGRGYTTAHIAEILSAWRSGDGLSGILGLERLVGPWAADPPETVPLSRARDLAGDATAFRRLVDARMIEVQGEQAVLHRPRLLEAYREMRGHGVPTPALVDLHSKIEPLLEQVSDLLVRTGAQQVASRLPAAGAVDITGADIDDLASLLIRFRTLAMESVTATLARTLEQRIERMLGDYLASLAGTPGTEEAG